MAKLTEREAIELKIGLLLMSIGVRLAILVKIADEARADGDERWHNLKPQIQKLRGQHNFVSAFLDGRKDIDFTNPPDFIKPALEQARMMNESESLDESPEPTDILIERPPPVTIKCKPGKLGARDGRRRHHRI